MPRTNFSSIALAVIGSEHRQKTAAQYLELIATDSWVGRLVENIVTQSAEQGHIEFAANPDHVLNEVHEAIRAWRVDLSYALQLAKLHPQHFAEPEKWHAENSEDGSAAA